MAADPNSTVYGIPSSNTGPSARGLLKAPSASTGATSPVGQSYGLAAPIPGSGAIASSTPSVQADFNNDGQQDILWRNYATGQNVVWFMKNGSLASSTYLQPVNDLNWRIEGVGDFLHNGHPDIIWRNYSSGQNMLWLMNGTSLVSTVSLTAITDLNWRIEAVADFLNNGQPDLLWRNYATGQDVIWLMNGASLSSTVTLPTVVGANLSIQTVADMNGDGNLDIIWRNYLSGENPVWLMNGTSVTSYAYLTPIPDTNWQLQGAGDYLHDGNVNLLWRNEVSGQNVIWSVANLSFSTATYPTPVSDLNWRISLNDAVLPASLLSTSNFSFSGMEGDRGTFQLRLTQAPQSNVTVTLTGGSYLVVDADGNIQNGTQNTITFTPADWNQPRTLSFIAEDDNSSADRLTGNTISYSLTGGFNASGTYEIGHVTNTYAPDPSRFNIDLDFRNDYVGFWTPDRRAIAQKAADDWAAAIASRWTGFQLNASINRLESAATSPYSFATKRYVDDLLIFVNIFQGSSGSEPALGGPDYDFGGWANSPAAYGYIPRVGQIAVNPTVFANQPDNILYDVVSHEIGHALGLVGLNWIGFQQERVANLQTATFNGAYATAVYGAPVPLQSQDGGDIYHPAARVNSIMSYGYIYSLPGPTRLDFAMLADSGYQVYGINA
jgi:phosphopantetheine adenylyltransferase